MKKTEHLGLNIGELTDVFDYELFLNENMDKLDQKSKETDELLAHIAINVKSFGAVGDGATLDYQAFKDAIDVIKNTGSGTLILEPNKKYLLFNGQALENNNMFYLEGIHGFSIQGNGSTWFFDDVNHGTDFNVFQLKNSSKINVQNIKLEGTNPQYPTVESRARFFNLLENVTDVNLNNIEGKNIRGFLTCSATDNTLLPNYENQSKRIKVSNVTGEVVRYGFGFAFNGSDVVMNNIHLNKIHRGYFPYGVKNHKVQLEVKNFDATGALLRSYLGKGLENIDLDIQSDNESVLLETPKATALVSLAFGDKQDAIFKNITLKINGVHPADKIDTFFRVTGYNVVGGTTSGTNSHTIDGLQVSGQMKGGSGRPIHFIIDQPGDWDTFTFRNFNFHDIYIDSSNSNNVILQPLVGSSSFRNIEAKSHFYLEKTDDGKDYLILIDNCKATNLSSTNFTAFAHYVNCHITIGDFHNHLNKTYTNTRIGNRKYTRNHQNQSFDVTTDLQLSFYNNPTLIARNEVRALGNLTTYDLKLKFREDTFYFGSRFTHPVVYRYLISFNNSTSGRIGFIYGEILLRSTSQSSGKVGMVIQLSKNVVVTHGTITPDLTSVSLTGDNEITFSLTSSGETFNDVQAIVMI